MVIIDYVIPPQGQVQLSASFLLLEEARSSGAIRDFALNQTSLEEVFIKLVTDSEGAAGASRGAECGDRNESSSAAAAGQPNANENEFFGLFSVVFSPASPRRASTANSVLIFKRKLPPSPVSRASRASPPHRKTFVP